VRLATVAVSWAVSAARGLHRDAGGLQGLDRVDRPDGLDGGLQVLAHPAEVDGHLADVDAEPAGRAGARRGVGGGEQRLGGDAPGPQAVAAGAVALHQLHPRPEARGGLRAYHPRRPAADDQQVHHIAAPSPAHDGTVGGRWSPDWSVTVSGRYLDSKS
jgi:hypothetical protein